MNGEIKDDFKLFGLTKSEFEQKFVSSDEDVVVTVSETDDLLDLKVTYSTGSRTEKYDSAIKAFFKTFGRYVYAFRDVTLKEQLVDLLKLNDCMLASAESFTGGNVAASIISVAGASKVFYEGVVAYDSRAKIARLGVKPETLSKFKPVSCQVAKEMAEGLLKSGNCDIGVSTTGIAGPLSDESGFPVGRCYVGVAYMGEVEAFEYDFSGDRATIIKSGVNAALFQAIKNIQREVNLC